MKNLSIRTLAALLAMLLMLGGCGEKPAETQAAEEAEEEIVEEVEEPAYEYDSAFPKTPMKVTYDSLYSAAPLPIGDLTVMFIPIIWNEGYDFDEAYMKKLDDRFYRDSDSLPVDSVRTYYERASYGKLNLSYELMEPYITNDRINEKTFAATSYLERAQLFAGAYLNALDCYEGDISRFDADDDGYADIVIFINNCDPVGVNPGFGIDDYVTEEVGDAPLLLGGFINAYAQYIIDEGGYGSNVLAYEIAEALYIDDYSDKRNAESYLGGYDLMDGMIGDWNSFSKLAVGWLDPYVVGSDVKKVTLKIGSLADTGDAILIPSSEGWNGTPFDEYLLIEVLAPSGNNEKPFTFYNEDINHPQGGVRILHVDAKYIYSERNQEKGLTWIDFDSYDISESYGIRNAYNNNSDKQYASPDPNPLYHELVLIPSTGEVKHEYAIKQNYLFHEGYGFSMRFYQEFFPNGIKLNHGGKISGNITIDYYDEERHEAYITIDR